MEQQIFSVTSRNTLQHLSLHDCQCSRLYSCSGKLVFEMDWVEVLSEHPDNPYSQSHQSGPGRIELLDPVLESGALYPAFADKHPQPVSLSEIQFQKLILLSFAEDAAQRGYRAEIFALFCRTDQYDSVKLEVAYAESAVMWNKLGGLSWFERHPGSYKL